MKCLNLPKMKKNNNLVELLDKLTKIDFSPTIISLTLNCLNVKFGVSSTETGSTM